MKSFTPTQLRSNLYRILDDVALTGIPIEIHKGGKRFRIVPLAQVDKLSQLKKRTDFINGDPDDLIHMNWEQEISLDLP